MVGIVDLPKTKLAISQKLPLVCNTEYIVLKVNELIDRINFLDEHINFLYERSRTQYNTLVSQGTGLQNVYDEFQEFKKRFHTFERAKNELIAIEPTNSTRNPERLSASNVPD